MKNSNIIKNFNLESGNGEIVGVFRIFFSEGGWQWDDSPGILEYDGRSRNCHEG